MFCLLHRARNNSQRADVLCAFVNCKFVNYWLCTSALETWLRQSDNICAHFPKKYSLGRALILIISRGIYLQLSSANQMLLLQGMNWGCGDIGETIIYQHFLKALSSTLLSVVVIPSNSVAHIQNKSNCTCCLIICLFRTEKLSFVVKSVSALLWHFPNTVDRQFERGSLADFFLFICGHVIYGQILFFSGLKSG